MRVGVRALVVALLGTSTLGAGCAPSLRSGVYDCTDGACPSGMSCWSDHVCRTERETDAGPGGNDTGMPPRDGSTGDHCPGGCTPPALCAQGEDPAQHRPEWSCISTNAPARHGASCTPGDSTCTVPDGCVLGACMRPCAPPELDPCGFGETCATVTAMGSMMAPICARPCPGPCPMGTACNTAMRLCLPPGW